ncbi:unannotated protein [freshwater metagenome]|uniref:Unannotated protein n=1 Tax=freshwater metagenome TaxID=449393 RepID=A0A6J7HRB9_9ZZZZ
MVLVTLVLVSGAIRAAERDRTQTSQTSQPTQTSAPAPAVTTTPAPAQAPLQASLPSQKPVSARSGQIIELSVQSATPDIARIRDLGVSVPVGPGLEGTATFSAGAPGRYAVTLELAGQEIGAIDVSGS